jgi:putative phosphoesterase
MKAAASITPFVVGIISDTHGPVPKAALDALDGVHHILHAGDVVDDTVAYTLRTIASTTVVRGNMDHLDSAAWGPLSTYITLAGINIYMLHDLFRLDIEPKDAGVSMVVHGHTHQARIEWIRDVLYINPGSAAKPRGGRPASIAKVTITAGILAPEIILLG